MSFSKLIPSLLVTALALGVTTTVAEAKPAAKAKPIQSRIVVENIDLEGVHYDDATGLLTATGGTVSGTIAGLPFTTDVTNFALQHEVDAAAAACSVLDLELGPIDLDLLGLHVDTSPICLSVTAFEGEGILGDLLCGLAGGNLDLLDGVLSEGLPEILNESLAEAAPAQQGAEDICDGECEVLDLAIGPVDLDLLGVNVHLDNCEDGPVQVCVSASEGALLGDLLCALTGGGVLPDLGDLEDLLGELTGLTDRQVDRLVAQVRRLIRDGNLSVRDIEQLVRFVQRLVQPA